MASNGSSDFQEVVNTAGSASPEIVTIRRVPGEGDLPLSPETQYDFKAIAVNNVDVCLMIPTSLDPAGLVSARTGPAAVPGVPPAPYLLSATGGQLSIELVKPPNMNGSALTGFSIMVNDTVYGFMATNDSTAYSINFLSAETPYAVQVAVVTNLGTTNWSALVILETTAATIPSAPRYLNMSNVTASSAILQWSLPLDSGGADITGEWSIRLILYARDIAKSINLLCS